MVSFACQLSPRTVASIGRIVTLYGRLPARRLLPISYASELKPRLIHSQGKSAVAHGKIGIASSPRYHFIYGVERLEKYDVGGYHPTEVGSIFHERYEIVDKLGFGGWSIVWLAYDHHLDQFVALKIGVADSLPHEIKILRALSTPSTTATTSTTTSCPASIPLVLDEFSIDGPNGTHPCFTTSLARGNLRESSFSRLFRADVARALAYELALAVAYVHSCGFVHGGTSENLIVAMPVILFTDNEWCLDIHLRNVLLRAQPEFHNMSIPQFHSAFDQPVSSPIERQDGLPLTPNVPSKAIIPLDISKNARELLISDARLLLSDFGESFAPSEERRLGRDCHTLVDFRPPEAVFEPDSPLSFSADIWMLATAIWDILGMQAVFSSAFYSDEEVMCQIVDTLGPLPAKWLEKWKDREQFFDSKGAPMDGRFVWPRLDQAFEERVMRFRREEDDMGIFSREESVAILHMLGGMLRLEPGDRSTISQVLKSDWMMKWAYVDYERSQKDSPS